MAAASIRIVGGTMSESGDRVLEQAVARGIITSAQADAIRALGPVGETGAAPSAAPTGAPPATGRRLPLDAATIAYVLGAVIVVVAMGWFLADRWEWLGPWGAFATSVLYAAVLAVTARILRREGFALPSGIAWLLVVATVPPMTIALTEITGWFVAMPPMACTWVEFDFLACRGEEVLVELATLAAALVIFRRVRFAPLVAVMAAVGVRMLFHLSDALGASTLGFHTQGWIWCAGACLTLAAAIEAERRQPDHLDLARWLHLVAMLCAIPGTIQLVGTESAYKHLLPAVAFVSFALALLLRRLAWLVFGMGCFAGYVVWLANSVFRDTPAFPIVLAALGIALIVATVWMQRNAARLAARFGVADVGGRPHFPGGPWLFLLPVLLAAAMVPTAQREDAEQRAAFRWTVDRQARRARQEAARAVESRARAAERDARRDAPTPR